MKAAVKEAKKVTYVFVPEFPFFIGYRKAKAILKSINMDIRAWASGGISLPTGAYLARGQKKRWVICGYKRDGSDVLPYIN